jgi:hypothetical protein
MTSIACLRGKAADVLTTENLMKAGRMCEAFGVDPTALQQQMPTICRKPAVFE